MAKFWYAFNEIEDPFKASSYSRIIPPRVPICVTGAKICAIYANGSSFNIAPNGPFTVNLQQYITLALVSGHVPQPNGLGVKHYVYLKD